MSGTRRNFIRRSTLTAAGAYLGTMGHPIQACRNNDELFDKPGIDGVFISTADFQHALHTVEAVKANCDVYCEKPFAETMEDARTALKAVKQSGRIVQIGSQRRSGKNYQAAADFIRSGKFGPITAVELTWNVNQPGRWRRPALVAKCVVANGGELNLNSTQEVMADENI